MVRRSETGRPCLARPSTAPLGYNDSGTISEGCDPHPPGFATTTTTATLGQADAPPRRRQQPRPEERPVDDETTHLPASGRAPRSGFCCLTDFRVSAGDLPTPSRLPTRFHARGRKRTSGGGPSDEDFGCLMGIDRSRFRRGVLNSPRILFRARAARPVAWMLRTIGSGRADDDLWFRERLTREVLTGR